LLLPLLKLLLLLLLLLCHGNPLLLLQHLLLLLLWSKLLRHLLSGVVGLTKPRNVPQNGRK
jgi:hypothetical protein